MATMEEICRKKAGEIHVLISDLDMWNRTVYTGFLRYVTKTVDYEDFFAEVKRRLDYLQVPKELYNEFYKLNAQSSFQEVADFLYTVRKFLMERIDNVIRATCKECSAFLTMPKEAYTTVIPPTPAPTPTTPPTPHVEEETLSPEEREIRAKVTPTAPAETVEKEAEEVVAGLTGKELLALPRISYSAFSEELQKQLESKQYGKLFTEAFKEFSEPFGTDKYLDLRKRWQDIFYEFLTQIERLTQTFPELTEATQYTKFLKGLIILAEKRVVSMEETEEGDLTFTVKSKTEETYKVEISVKGGELCTCPDFQKRHTRCKHIYACIVSLFVKYWQEVKEEEREEKEE